MARHTRKNGVFRRVYSPVKHAIMAGKESIRAVTNTASNVACDGLTGLDRIGTSVASHANMAVNDLLGKRKTRRGKRSMYRKKSKKAGKR
jgi:hypothetical protein